MRGASLAWLVAGLVAPALMLANPALSAGGDRELGKHLSSECVTCHQITGRITAGIPAIISMPEDQFIAMMNGYRDKVRDNQVMQTIAVKFKDDEIAALAAYFGSLKKR
ncbi:MAG: c-type cytochrome [Bosea sp. (in: a-proteobacteria)]